MVGFTGDCYKGRMMWRSYYAVEDLVSGMDVFLFSSCLQTGHIPIIRRRLSSVTSLLDSNVGNLDLLAYRSDEFKDISVLLFAGVYFLLFYI